MATKAGYKGGAKKDQVPAKPRKTVDPLAVMSRAVAGYQAGENPADAEPKVTVDVPRDFNLTDDGHLVTSYKAGRQKMPRSHAEHFYAKANGVRVVESKEAKAARQEEEERQAAQDDLAEAGERAADEAGTGAEG